MKDRIVRFMTAEGLSSSKLADEIGVQRSSVSHLLGGRNNPSYEFIHKLLSRFPRVNAEWLVMGTGSMYKDMHQADLFASSAPREPEKEKETVPVPEQPVALPTDTPVTGSGRIEPEDKQEIVVIPAKKASGNKLPVRMILVFEDSTFKSFELSDN